jgi:putative nucleotidyltransferase with HDIG domain
MSQILAKRIMGREDTRLFTAALLHDIGKVILGECVYEMRDRFRHLMTDGSRSFLEVEEELLGLNHAEVGGTIAAAWNFPEEVHLAIAYHHRPDLSTNQESPVPWIIHLADQACLMLGIGRGTDGLAYHGLEDAIRRFDLSRSDYEDGLSLLVKELDAARELIGIVQPVSK